MSDFDHTVRKIPVPVEHSKRMHPPSPSHVTRVAGELAAGNNVVIEAVPGAGKTHLLAELTKDGVPCLFLAYNAELAGRLSLRLDPSVTTCVTFHALCGRCLRLARNDDELLSAVEAAERGEISPKDVPLVRRVFVDEAQDVRGAYTRLLRVLGLAGDGMSLVLAGDENQLIYDFDPDFPASLQALHRPEEVLGGAGRWERVTLPASRRLTRPMAEFANAVFGTSIEADRDGPRVELRVPRSSYADLFPLLKDIILPADGKLEGQSDILLLVDRKRGNRPLRCLVNAASRAGVPVRVHSVNSDAGGIEDDGTDGGSLQCGTFWSAKGLECSTVVVLLPGRAARNPLYVALTRATERLVVVLDPRDPHPLVCRAAEKLPSCVSVQGGAVGELAVEKGCAAPEEGAFSPAAPRRSVFSSLDFHAPRAALLEDCVERETVQDGREGGDASTSPTGGFASEEDSFRGSVIVRMALLRAEFLQTGVARAARDVFSPTRLESGAATAEAIRCGLASRAVPTHITDESLLASDLRGRASLAYATCTASAREGAPLHPLSTVALAVEAWDGWDHVMRRARLSGEWAETARETVEFVSSCLPPAGRGRGMYDVRLVRSDSHVRVHATCPERCYHVVWCSTSEDVGRAAVRASLHPRRVCRLIDAASHSVVDVRVSEVGPLLPSHAC